MTGTIASDVQLLPYLMNPILSDLNNETGHLPAKNDHRQASVVLVLEERHLSSSAFGSEHDVFLLDSIVIQR